MIYPAHAAGARRADLGASAARTEADGRAFRLALAHNGQRQRQRMADRGPRGSGLSRQRHQDLGVVLERVQLGL